MPNRNGRPAWLPTELFPFESRYTEIDGCKVHYVDEGSGPVLLFLHGNPTWSFLYRNIIAGLRDSFRCIALDYPGFGLSEGHAAYGFRPADHSDIVERFVLEHGLEDVTLMGQDWGGPIGLTVATRHPDRFGGFILGNTWAWPLNGIVHFELFARLMGSRITKPLIRNANAFVNVMIPLGTASRVPPDVMRAYREPFASLAARTPTWQFPRELLQSRPFMERLRDDLPKVADRPALLLWGGKDFALRRRVELPQFQSLFPNHQTTVLEDAKHFFQEDAPEAAAAAIRSWMSERAATSTTPAAKRS